MTMKDFLYLIPLFPLLGALCGGLLALRRKPANEIFAGVVASLMVLVSFAFSLLAFLELWGLGETIGLHQIVYPWIAVGALHINLSFAFDNLTAVMTLVITGVGFLIHVYAIGYMRGDRGFQRFFTYLNLFVFAMLMLVLGSNMVVMFIGWEGVGLCSYLLIGFFYEKKSAADAGKKAFVVNRIGDFGFLLAMFLTYYQFGSLEFATVANKLGGVRPQLVTAITLLLFLGATGKSAQIPLYFWLPDAMEGPTPVSALIHAATMVTAGVYLVARTHFLFALAPLSQAIVAGVGCLTAFYAATIAFAQRDLKRILAYSTISQLGYMFVGVGVGAYAAGIFHLMTHAFFKALLFLGAGSVMHALSGELDIYKMGGLRKQMPKTCWTFVIGALAISGIPPLAGFFSKDEILWRAFSTELKGIPPVFNYCIYGLGLLTAGMTAFYMFRAVFLTFFGESRLTPELARHAHESPAVMTTPLLILALLSIGGGLVGVPDTLLNALGRLVGAAKPLPGGELFAEWLRPVVGAGAAEHETAGLEIGLMAVSVGVALLGIFLAYVLYRRNPAWPAKIVAALPRLHRLVWNKYYVDEINDAVVVRPLKRASANFLWQFVDAAVIDGLVNGAGSTAKAGGGLLTKMQTGKIYAYALSILLGAAALLGFALWAW
jgi:NADH-quinone oxidoreductase subunit L